MAFLVLIETSGNQHYIFSTNRLRENAGASEIIFRAGTKLVIDAIGDALKQKYMVDPYKGLPVKTAGRVEKLVEIGEKPDTLKSSGVEIIISTSGKALLLVNDRDIGDEIIWQVTSKALTKYPGLAMLGIVGDEIDVENGSVKDAHEAIKQIHKDIEKLKSRLASPLLRFATIPFVHPCESSGLPANEMAKKPGSDNEAPFSKVVLKKRAEGKGGFERVADDIGEKRLSHSTDTLDKMEELDWSAIVHADGNGFGGLFLNFDEQPGMKGKTGARDYFNLLRRFSGSLELCGLAAFKAALESVKTKTYRTKKDKLREFLPIVPLILGGDDLTVVMDGRQALEFTAAYQRAFEAQTIADEHSGVQNFIKKVTGDRVLGSGAGVAIVKPHYPFHRAYELAEKLISSAKKSKSILGSTAISTLDFHILFDNGATSLGELRQQLGYDRETGPKERLSLRPYVVSDDVAIDKERKANEAWCNDWWIAPRKWVDLRNKAKKLARAPEVGNSEKTIPSSQLHMLRDALYEGKGIVEARYGLIAERYEGLPDGGKLYFSDDDKDATWLLDAMELMDIEQLYQQSDEHQSGQKEDAA